MSNDTTYEKGQATGRFCPSCRSAMVYTGSQRTTPEGPSAEQRCSNRGYTAWKRLIFGSAAATDGR